MSRESRVLRVFLASAAASGAWILCEVGGGLLFLVLGVRLWRYEIAPLFLDITSPVVWLLAFLLITPLTMAFELGPWGRKALPRLAFLMVAGPVVEVLLNRWLFEGLLGRPLYRYTFLPTFDGSGSLLSPLYYATLHVHAPLTDLLLERTAAGSLQRVDQVG